ncbi:folate-sensitive fragile site protein Fra10Ac1-domain-containing protein [Suillus fuscotomentosus]|uniref:Folate-sensitive fragile site protein Fra10Ac1-domain-containing protein n=1 Tax=Suillus fuscotomentosus TaxID=1912939 RepID=A0AAD4DU27_9AGAM|nr:folate-sensitive fragile site protein Fra10Ac1-domain-containing protein [Suillus fuscotomentosus]KAG1893852.1 folate-sensitive fragile site protein Fra10Ac1-domain-containing protein [Suillus fuscotomentosus]
MSALYKPYVSNRKTTAAAPTVTEFDILKASHKFLRDGADDEASTSWNDQLAQKYYESLYREFAICDLKHYRSGNFSLRWRTETEVLSGTGETTCANARCVEHAASSTSLTTLELPFTYEEHGQRKEALVKVVLCSKCVRKIMWKRKHEKRSEGEGEGVEAKTGESDKVKMDEDRRAPESRSRTKDVELDDIDDEQHRARRRRSSRSRSPRAHKRNRDASPTLLQTRNSGS